MIIKSYNALRFLGMCFMMLPKLSLAAGPDLSVWRPCEGSLLEAPIRYPPSNAIIYMHYFL